MAASRPLPLKSGLAASGPLSDTLVHSVTTLIAVMTALDIQLTGLGSGKTSAQQLVDRRRKLWQSLDQMAARTSMSRATIASLRSVPLRGFGPLEMIDRQSVICAVGITAEVERSRSRGPLVLG